MCPCCVQVGLRFELPHDARLVSSGSAFFSPRGITLAARGPALALDTTLLISTPAAAQLRNADTQVPPTHCLDPQGCLACVSVLALCFF